MAIDLTRPRGPSVEQSASNITRALDLVGQREQVRQDRQRIADFVSENIRLAAANPDMDPDQVAQLAAVNITEKDPAFDPGIVGGLQKFAGGLTRGPSTTLTGPIAEGLLAEPTGIRRDLIKSQIEANRARTVTTGPVKATPEQKQRDSDIAVLNREAATPTQKNEAKERLVSSGELVEVNESPEVVDQTFSDIMDELTGTRKRVKGNVLDKRFEKESFDKGLEDAQEIGLKEGVDPDSIRGEFEKWWDSQFEAEKGQRFQKFQDRAEFQEEASDITAVIEAALKAGKISQEEMDSATRILKADPAKEPDIRKALGL